MIFLTIFFIWYAIGACSAFLGTVIDYIRGESITVGDIGKILILSLFGPIILVFVINHIDHIYKFSSKILFVRK